MRKPKTFRPWNPEQTLLFLYAYCVGIPSSRVLTGNQQPDHSRISDFRLVHLDALAGLVSLGNVALDGTKV